MLEIGQPDHRHPGHIQGGAAIAHLLFVAIQGCRARAQLPKGRRERVILAGVTHRIDNARKIENRAIGPPRARGDDPAILQQIPAQTFQHAIAHLVGKLGAFREHHLAISLNQLHIAARGCDPCIAIIGQLIGAQHAPALEGFHSAACHYQGSVLIILDFIGRKSDGRVLRCTGGRRWRCGRCGRLLGRQGWRNAWRRGHRWQHRGLRKRKAWCRSQQHQQKISPGPAQHSNHPQDAAAAPLPAGIRRPPAPRRPIPQEACPLHRIRQ